MDLQLDDKVVIITGGSDGLGLSVAGLVAAAGGRVCLVGRSSERLEAAASSFAEDQVLTVASDVTEAGALERVVDETVARWGRLDGLVNGAGIHTEGDFEDIADDYWRDDFELKLLATIRGIRLALPHLRVHGGAVVNVLSVWARYQERRTMPSAIFRSAALALTNGVSKEVAGDGVRVNAVLVGEVESGQHRRLAERLEISREEMLKIRAEANNIPAGRLGQPEEFSDLVAFLLSPRSAYITGVGINFDGGFSPVA